MSSVTTIGMCTYDEFLLVGEYPEEDTKSMTDKTWNDCGGMAANVAINLQELGQQSALITTVGMDTAGDHSVLTLRECGVDTSGIRTGGSATQRTWVVVSRRSGSRTAIATSNSPMGEIDDVRNHLIEDSQLLYMDSSVEPAVAEQAFGIASRNGIPTFFNLEFYTEAGVTFFQRCTYGVASSVAWSTLSGDHPHDVLLKGLWKSGSVLKGVTSGARGSLFYDGTALYKVPACNVKVVDSTGAGDAFQSALILGVLRRWDIERTLLSSTALAGLKCGLFGAHVHESDLQSVARLAATIQMTVT